MTAHLKHTRGEHLGGKQLHVGQTKADVWVCSSADLSEANAGDIAESWNTALQLILEQGRKLNEAIDWSCLVLWNSFQIGQQHWTGANCVSRVVAKTELKGWHTCWCQSTYNVGNHIHIMTSFRFDCTHDCICDLSMFTIVNNMYWTTLDLSRVVYVSSRIFKWHDMHRPWHEYPCI